jgi:hypothetical protein
MESPGMLFIEYSPQRRAGHQSKDLLPAVMTKFLKIKRYDLYVMSYVMTVAIC